MTLGRSGDGKGIVYVGSAGAGKVYAVEYEASGRANVRTVASRPARCRQASPTATARSSSARSARVLRFDGIDDKLAAPPAPVRRQRPLPVRDAPRSAFIAFGPDGKLYVSVGAPCNVCLPDDRHGVIQRMNVDGSAIETVARGVRNSVGFDWSPVDRTLWFTDNGRDMLGDDLPADELTGSRGRRAFRLPVLPPGRLARSGVRRASARAASSPRRRPSSAPRRRARHALLRRRAVPGGVPRQHLHRRARLVEPQQEERLPGRSRRRRRVRAAPGRPSRSCKASCRSTATAERTSGAGPRTCCRCRTARSW